MTLKLNKSSIFIPQYMFDFGVFFTGNRGRGASLSGPSLLLNPSLDQRGPAVGPCTSTSARTRTRSASTSTTSSISLKKVCGWIQALEQKKSSVHSCSLFVPPQTRRVGGRAGSVGGKVCSLETMWKRSELSWTRSARKSIILPQFLLKSPPPPSPASRVLLRPSFIMDAVFVSKAADIWATSHLFMAPLYKQSSGDTVGVVVVNTQVRHKSPLRFPSLSWAAPSGIPKPWHLWLWAPTPLFDLIYLTENEPQIKVTASTQRNVLIALWSVVTCL